MKRSKLLYILGMSLFVGMSLISCDDFLDENPDNRTELDTEEKIISLLTSAYTSHSYAIINECLSDNTDDMGPRYSKYDDRFINQAYTWNEMKESDNDGVMNMWQGSYSAISAANHALQAIEELPEPLSVKMKEAKGEALLCRAYHHFILVNEFCQNYNVNTSAKDLGIPYMTTVEAGLNPHYDRGTVAEVYSKMEKDIEEALPLVGDTHYKQPKYHFNKQAAYAFAERFYLFYEKWDKALECANICLGTAPKSLLRDWDEMASYGITNNLDPRNNLYIKASAKCNFLMTTAVSSAGIFFSNYINATKYSHNSFISKNETLEANNIWGGYTMMRCLPLVFKGGTMDRALVAKTPMMFEEKDPVSKTGYFHTVAVPFRADISLLERAEAYVMLKQYDKACQDLTVWMQNWAKTSLILTPETVKQYYDNMNYYTSFAPSQKRHLYPAFAIEGEGSIQESMLHCVLNFKRLETIHEGLRWFDVKRYGINITRRVMNSSSEPETLVDSLLANDPRRAIQLPMEVTSVGMEANPGRYGVDPDFKLPFE